MKKLWYICKRLKRCRNQWKPFCLHSYPHHKQFVCNNHNVPYTLVPVKLYGVCSYQGCNEFPADWLYIYYKAEI